MTNLKKAMILATLTFLIGCETGKGNQASTNEKTASGIVSKGSKAYKPSIPKSSEIRKIYSKSGTPGYYIQVGYFKEKEPSGEFINRMDYSQLPYTLLKKYKNSKLNYYALVGPYRSYSKAKEMMSSAKEFVSSSAFIVEVVRP